MRLFADSIPGVVVTSVATCGGNSFPDPNGGCTNVMIGDEVRTYALTCVH